MLLDNDNDPGAATKTTITHIEYASFRLQYILCATRDCVQMNFGELLVHKNVKMYGVDIFPGCAIM